MQSSIIFTVFPSIDVFLQVGPRTKFQEVVTAWSKKKFIGDLAIRALLLTFILNFAIIILDVSVSSEDPKLFVFLGIFYLYQAPTTFLVNPSFSLQTRREIVFIIRPAGQDTGK
jgi:hypothetical protein